MDITENKLQQIIIEELKEVLGMDQEYTGSEMDVDAENDLAGALMSLKAAGYTRDEIVEMVNNEFGEASDSGKVDPNWARQKYAPMKGDKTRYSKHLEDPDEPLQEAIEDMEWEGPPGINDFDGGVQIVNSRHGTDVFLNDRLVATGFFDHSADAFFMEKSSKSFNSMPEMAAHYGSGEPGLKYVGQGEPMEENCGCPSCPEHGSGAKIRVKVK